MIIASNSIFGFNIYRRIRLYEKKLIFSTSEIHCDDIGLYIIGQYPNLEYNFVSLFQKKEWNFIAADTINLVILNLIISGDIEVYEFEDESAYISKLIKRKTKSYYIKTIKTTNSKDLLTKDFLFAVNKIEKSEFKVKDLTRVIHVLLDKYLGSNDEYNRPEKYFIIKVLKKYSKMHHWLKIVSTKKMLGIYKDHKIEIERIYIPRISMQHENLINFHFEELRKSLDYKMFRRKLREILDSDFRSRLPKNDD